MADIAKQQMKDKKNNVSTSTTFVTAGIAHLELEPEHLVAHKDKDFYRAVLIR